MAEVKRQREAASNDTESGRNPQGCGCFAVILAAVVFVGSQVRSCVKDYIAEGEAEKVCQERVDKLDEREWNKRGVKEQCMREKKGKREDEKRRENEEIRQTMQDVLDVICVLDPDCHFRDRR